MDLIQSYFSCQHPLGKVCKEILFRFPPLLGHLDMDWGWSEQQPGTSNDSFPPPIPHAELPLSRVHFALGPFWKSLPNRAALRSCQIPADSEVSYFQAGDKWCLMPVCGPLVPTHGKGPSRADLQTPGCCLPPEVTSSWELLRWYGCYPDAVQAGSGRTQPEPGAAALVGKHP